jgi:hypothetical protein
MYYGKSPITGKGEIGLELIRQPKFLIRLTGQHGRHPENHAVAEVVSLADFRIAALFRKKERSL